MGSSSARASLGLFLSLSLLFFGLICACETNPTQNVPNPTPATPKIATPIPTPTPTAPKIATPVPTSTAPKIATPVPTPTAPKIVTPVPTPTPTAPKIATHVPTPTYGTGKCPQDALKLGVCANVLNLVNVVVGSPPTMPCCSLIQGLVDLEAALCLCTAIRANILGINLDVPVALSLVLNNCGKKVPSGFECS